MSRSWWMLGLAFIWFVHENVYYGWNTWPESEGELLADFGVFLLAAWAMTLRRQP